MKPIKPALIALIVAVIAAPAAANLRAPRKVDGTFSGSLAAGPAGTKLRLMAERLSAAFPRMSLSQMDPKALVYFQVEYEIENAGSGPATVPLRFLAVDIKDLMVELDGKPLAAAVKPAPEEKAECVALMAKHRESFLSGFYKDFLSRLRTLAGLEGETNESWIARLQDKGIALPAWGEVFPKSLEDSEAADPAAADFEAVFPPGRSTLIVRYGQRMFIDERGHGYFAAWPKKGVSGFDYLLYPAKAWPTDPGFKLAVAIEVPEAAGKKLFFNVYKKPSVRASLPLREVPGCAWGNGSTYKGEFTGGMPADVLTFLLWFDEGAAAYVH